MNNDTLNTLADEILDGCPPEALADHESAASHLRDGNITEALNAVDAWPETYAFIRAAINADGK